MGNVPEEIKDVCKIGIGSLDRAKNAHKYFESNEKSKKNKLAIFNFENIDAVFIEKICKQVLKRINSTEFYQIEFYKACLLFKCLGGNLDDNNSQNIDRSKISIKITSRKSNEIPLTTRFAEQIMSLIDNSDNSEIQKIKKLLNNNGNRNILLTEEEFMEFNKDGTRTGWEKGSRLL